MATEAQTQANRENSELSTGPKDTSNTKFNALKHGLCSKGFVNDKENEEYSLLFEELKANLGPKTIIQHIVIERIAIALWDLQKITVVESARNRNQEIKSKLTALGKPMFDLDMNKKRKKN